MTTYTIAKWKAIVVNPLGKEAYNLVLDNVGDSNILTASSEKGVVKFMQAEKLSPMFVADIETPMKTKLELEFSTGDFTAKNISAFLRIGDFSSMQVDLVTHE
jgi:hypothetical protein